MLEADSEDGEIIRFLSGYDKFDFNGTYYAMKSLKLAGAKADFQSGKLRWCYNGDEQQRPCIVPTTPLIRYFKYELYGRYGSSIFSSSLSTVLKRIELGADNIGHGSNLVPPESKAKGGVLKRYRRSVTSASKGGVPE
jgi:hypothetical protein